MVLFASRALVLQCSSSTVCLLLQLVALGGAGDPACWSGAHVGKEESCCSLQQAGINIRHLQEDERWAGKSAELIVARTQVESAKQDCFDQFYTFERCCEGPSSQDVAGLQPPNISLGVTSALQLTTLSRCWPNEAVSQSYWRCCALPHGLKGNSECFPAGSELIFEDCCLPAVAEGLDECTASSGGWCNNRNVGLLADSALDHRSYIGRGDGHDFFYEEGQRQFNFLLDNAGVHRGMRVLDLGCGALRLARLLIPYLEPGGYLGLDKSRRLIEAGWFLELDDIARGRSPHFGVSDRFEMELLSGGSPPEVSVSFSLLTHLNGTDISLLLRQLKKLSAGSTTPHRYFATVRVVEDHATNAQQRGTFSPGPDASEPSNSLGAFFYTRAELHDISTLAGWKAEFPAFRADYYHSGGKHQMVLFQSV